MCDPVPGIEYTSTFGSGISEYDSILTTRITFSFVLKLRHFTVIHRELDMFECLPPLGLKIGFHTRHGTVTTGAALE